MERKNGIDTDILPAARTDRSLPAFRQMDAFHGTAGLRGLRQDAAKAVSLGAEDVIPLYGGGHGFEESEEVEMIEVKQGPYARDADKTRFVGVKAPSR